MADVEAMLEEVLRSEGGFVNHPDDRGGATNMGITQATLSQYLGQDATVDDVRALSLETAKEIYRQKFLAEPKIDRLPDLIQPVMFDAAVNSGPGRAIKWLQQELNRAGHGPLSEDGAIGPKTIEAAEKAVEKDGTGFSRALVERRRSFLMALCAQNPSQKVFERGWMARCDRLEANYC